MLAENVETAPMTQADHRASFFRQSGWLMIANIAGGVLMYAVHFLARATGKSEYGVFGTLLTMVMLVPAIPLQMVLAQQSARALAIGKEPELSGIIRMIWGGLFGLWAVACVLILVFQGSILKLWGVTNPVALWVTLPVILLSLWMPLFCGALQGQQNFLWLGWSMLSNAIGRLFIAALFVLALGSGAVGMMAGVMAGLFVALVIAAWQTRALWRLAPATFDYRAVLRQVVPLLFGFVFVQFLFTGDTMFVKHYFSEDETGAYVAAGTMSRALIWLVGPLASVMFPRIVHSTAKSEKTNLTNLVLMGTAVLTVGGAAGLAVLGPMVVKIVYGEGFVGVAGSVLPWYAAAMVPLALANVLVNDLLARSEFRVVPFIFLLAATYSGALVFVNHSAHSLVAVLQTLGLFNLLLLAVCSWFSWEAKARNSKPSK
jgi:O-antigen/teichoic acid export membrane protein